MRNTPKSYRIKNAVAEIYEEKGLNRLRFGSDDKLPNKLINIVDASGTGRLCIGRRRDFIFGKGFANKDIAKARINKIQIANNLLKEVSVYASYFEGFYLNIKYDLSGKPISIYHLKVEKIRRMEDGRFRYNERMGERLYKMSEDIYYHPFNPNLNPVERNARIKEEIGKYGQQLGDILLIHNYGAGYLKENYPIPDYYSAIEDIESDAAIAKLEKRNIKKGWRANVVIETVGEMDTSNKDENGLTEQDRFDKGINDFCGEEGASVLHIPSKSATARARVYPFNLNEILDATDKATTRLANKVCRNTGVPPVLIGLTTPGQLGNTKEVINHIKLFNLFVTKMQMMIEEALATVWPEIDWTIEQLNLIDELPDWLIEVMSIEEKRILGKNLIPNTEGGNNAN